METVSRTPEEEAQRVRFALAYQRNQADAKIGIERRVCGCDYGGTSWSTREEADRFGKLLELAPGRRLLEVGAGSGWPGLYLAKTSGCDIALIDLPFEALRIGAERAAREPAPGAHLFAVADGARPPFADAAFDAIVHSDVLCCLAAKAAVLRACRRVIGGRGRMAFTIILTTPGLSGDDYAEAVAGGPPFVATDVEYPELVRRAGWEIDFTDDITQQYAETLAHMLREEEAHADELRPLVGEADYADRLIRRRNGIDVLSRGLLRRELYFVRPV